MSDFIDFVMEMLLPLFLIFALVFGGGGLFAYEMASHQCSAQARAMGFEHQFGVFTDCMVRVDGQWILLSSYKTARVR